MIFQHKIQPHRFLLLLCVIWIAGCSHQQRAKVSTPQPPPPTVAQRRQPLPAQSAVIARLHEAGNILLQLIEDPNNAVSDAILNRTLCFAVFPDAASANASGLVTCRNRISDWTSPAVATLSASSEAQQGAVLLFIISDRVRQALLHSLQVGAGFSAEAGPSTQQKATLDQVELSWDAFAYVRTGNSLRGVALEDASINLNEAETGKLYGHRQNPQALLAGSTMSSTVTSGYVLDVGSFFNTITPAGIIVHHSVLVPTRNLRQPEEALDSFHYSRGLEISCFGKLYHIAYHYLILPNGDVRAGRPERCEGAHARGYNSYLGIALVGDFSSADNPRGKKGPMRPTKAQMASLVRLCRELRQKYNIPLQHIMPHSDVSRTECPGDRLEFSQVLLALQQSAVPGS